VLRTAHFPKYSLFPFVTPPNFVLLFSPLFPSFPIPSRTHFVSLVSLFVIFFFLFFFPLTSGAPPSYQPPPTDPRCRFFETPFSFLFFSSLDRVLMHRKWLLRLSFKCANGFVIPSPFFGFFSTHRFYSNASAINPKISRELRSSSLPPIQSTLLPPPHK